MTNRPCKVRNCDHSSKDNKSLYRIPRLKLTGPLTPFQQLRLRRRKAWLKALGFHPDQAFSNLREVTDFLVCSRHFVSGKPAPVKDVYDVDWVPSLHLGEDESSSSNKVVNPSSGSKNHVDKTKVAFKRNISDVSSNDETMTIILPPVSAPGTFVRRKLPKLKPSPQLIRELQKHHAAQLQSKMVQEVNVTPNAESGQFVDQNTSENIAECEEPNAEPNAEPIAEPNAEPNAEYGQHTDQDAPVDTEALEELSSLPETEGNDSSDVIKKLKTENQRLLSQNLSLKAKLLETEALYKSLETDHRISMSKFSDLRYSVDMFTVSEKTFVADEERVRHFTGLPTFDVLKAMFTHIEPFMDTYQYPLSKFQQYILTLMCIRLNVGFDLLGYVFRQPLSSVSKIFTRVLQVMHARYTPLISWPARPNLLQSVPLLFREKFGLKVVVIADTLELSVVIDTIEVRLDSSDSRPSPSTVVSDYSHPTTMKFLIGLTPQGAVTFVSKGFTESLSERELLRASGLVQNLEPGDIVFCGKGSYIHEIVQNKPNGNTEPKSGGSKKKDLGLKPYNVQNDQSICVRLSDVRLHTKRVTEAFKKTFIYWSSGLPVEFFNVPKDGLPAVDQMIQTCCALNNASLTVVT